MIDPGPYVSEDLGEWYYPIDCWRFNDARRDVAQTARDDGNKSMYIEKNDFGLHDHDDWEGCTGCRRPAYKFVVLQA
jgi:hypothetical protein